MTITTIKDFPRKIKEVENFWIPLSDGTRLAARMFIPKDAEKNPVPALLEYLPYRKRDGTHVRDALTHPYLAGHGYACDPGRHARQWRQRRADGGRVHQAGAG